MIKPINFKQAQSDQKAMKQFVAEHKHDVIEDKVFYKIINSMVVNKKTVKSNE